MAHVMVNIPSYLVFLRQTFYKAVVSEYGLSAGALCHGFRMAPVLSRRVQGPYRNDVSQTPTYQIKDFVFLHMRVCAVGGL